MNTGEFNKFFGAATSALLVFLLAGFFSEELYHLEEPEELAYALEIEEPDGAAEPEPEIDFASLLQTASADAGEQVFRKCSACHKVEDGANAVGPHLYDVVGRPIDAVAGYDYSGALEEQGDVWSFDNLNHFLENPQGWAPGTKMGFAGLAKAEDRAAVIVYLNEIGGTPEALPEPATAPVEEAAAPVEGEAEAADAADATPMDQSGVVQTDPTEAGTAEAELAEAVGAADGATGEQTTSEVSQAMSMANAEVNENETPGETEVTLEPATPGATPPPTPEAARSSPEAAEAATMETAEAEEAAPAQAEAAARTEDAAGEAGGASAAMRPAATQEDADGGAGQVEVAQAPAAGGEGRAAAQASAESGAEPAAAEGGEAQLGALEAALAAALLDDGALYRQECALCHSLAEGAHGIGPSLHGVIGREIASAPYYTYSDELAALDGRWSVGRLDDYLAAGAEAPGGHGGYAGAPTVATRAAVLAHVHEQAGGEGPLTAEAGESVAEAGETALAAVEETAEEAGAAVRETAEDAGAAVEDAAEATVEAAEEGAATALATVEEDAAAALETIEEGAATALETVEEDAAALAGRVGEGLAAAGVAVGEAVTKAGDAIEGAADDVGAAGETAMMETGEAVEGAGRALTEASGGEPIEVEGEDALATEPVGEEAEAPAAGAASAFAAAVAAADASDGQRIWRQCQACHRLEDGANAVGPHLHALIGRPIAGVEGYSYSDALQAKADGVWDWDALDGWLEDPREWAPGNKMTYRGLRDMEDRAAVVKYLNEEGGDPQPYR